MANTNPAMTSKDAKELNDSITKLTNVISKMSGGLPTTTTTMKTSTVTSTNAKILEGTIGKFVANIFNYSKNHIKTYYSRLESAASTIMNRIFGKVLDDLQPIIQVMRATADFTMNMIIKPLGKFLFTSFTSIGKWTRSLFSGGRKTTTTTTTQQTIATYAKKQVNHLKRIDINVRKIERNTSSKKKLAAGGNTFLARLAAARAARRGGILPTTNAPAGKGGVLSTITGGIGSLLSGGFGIVSSMIGSLGPIMGPLMGLLLGGGAVVGGWSLFKSFFPDQATWVTDNVGKPFMNFMTNTLLPKMVEVFSFVGGKLVDIVSDKLLGGGFRAKSEKTYEKSSEIIEEAKKTADPTARKALFQQSMELNKLAYEQEMYGAKREAWTGALGKVGGFFGGIGGLMMGSPTAGAIGGAAGATYVGNKIYDWFGTEPTLGTDNQKIPSRKKGGPVLINAHDGEFVLRREAVENNGLANIQALNDGMTKMIPSYAVGGLVDINGTIKKASTTYNVPENMIRAVIKTESNFRQDTPNSPKGAIGLMQLMPGTAKEMGVNPYDAEQNIMGGTKYLSQMLRTFKGNEKMAIGAYNAGPAGVYKWPKETVDYVSKVQNYMGRDLTGETLKSGGIGGLFGGAGASSPMSVIADIVRSTGENLFNVVKNMTPDELSSGLSLDNLAQTNVPIEEKTSAQMEGNLVSAIATQNRKENTNSGGNIVISAPSSSNTSSNNQTQRNIGTFEQIVGFNMYANIITA